MFRLRLGLELGLVRAGVGFRVRVNETVVMVGGTASSSPSLSDKG